MYNFYYIEGINELAKEPVEQRFELLFDHPTIITVGRLTKQKGHWHLIRAFKIVKNEIPNAKLVILGDGPLKSYLISLSKQLELEDDVYFLGFQKNPFKYLVNSDVYAFPSLYEGFPNALCEAMACGLPVISTD